MTREELEKTISKYRIGKTIKASITDESEMRSFPSMLITFRELIVDGKPPTQAQFVHAFKVQHPKVPFKKVVNRLRRAYLSFIREYHLGFLLREHFENVTYDVDLDVICGVDYVLDIQGQKFYIHAFVNTENSRYWRTVKYARHAFAGVHVDLPLDLSSGRHVGEFILYTDHDMERLKTHLHELME